MSHTRGVDLVQPLDDRSSLNVMCSATRCRQPGTWALQWNNPKLHPPERRKTWLACEDHLQSLTQYLSARDFLRETVAADTLA